MKVTQNNATYHINFQYHYDDVRRRRVTECAIVSYDEIAKERRVIARGSATCHPRDHYKKEVGRELALKRALDPFDCNIDREMRRLLWDAYWNRGDTPPIATPVIDERWHGTTTAWPPYNEELTSPESTCRVGVLHDPETIRRPHGKEEGTPQASGSNLHR
jgi:hypothetical protein